MSVPVKVKAPLPDGWMGDGCRRWLKGAAKKHPRIVEVGVWRGRSTVVLSRHAKGRVWAVDHWQGTPHDPEQHALYAGELAAGEEVFRSFLVALKTQISSGKVVPMRLPSLEAADLLLKQEGATIDMVFLDGDHTYEGVRDDITAWRKVLRNGGLLCGHDYAPRWAGVRRAVDEAFGDRVKVGPRSIWSVRP